MNKENREDAKKRKMEERMREKKENIEDAKKRKKEK